jgi:protein-S-isoprenylcysteine O-methyltransferase Ste14
VFHDLLSAGLSGITKYQEEFKSDLTLHSRGYSREAVQRGFEHMTSPLKTPGLAHGDMKSLAKAVVVASTVICVIVSVLFWLSSLITSLLGLPPNLNLQPALRMVGWAIFVTGIVALWLFRYRSPTTMIVSTYFTFVKMLTRTPVSRLGGRTEPLIVDGPQKYVRHPLYLAAVTMFFGWALFTNSTSSLIGVAFMLLWFTLVQIPFEEREMRALFGDQYVRYSNEVPMLIPFSKRRRKDGGSKSEREHGHAPVPQQ